MRMIVLLKPIEKRGTKTAYTNLRKFLVSEGYECLLKDLFMRVVPNRKALKKYRDHIKDHLPNTGTVIMFSMTEKQWKRIEYLQGEPSYQEQVVGSCCHIML